MNYRYSHCSIDSASELTWETPEENEEFLSPMPEEDEENVEDDDDEDATKKLVSNGNAATNLIRMAPLSTISEVTLFHESNLLVRMLLTIFHQDMLVCKVCCCVKSKLHLLPLRKLSKQLYPLSMKSDQQFYMTIPYFKN